MRLIKNRAHAFKGVSFALLALVAVATLSHAADSIDRPVARQSPEWLRDAVVYEIFPRSFSAEGNFKGVVPQLDRLKELGVTVIWLMPIHPMGKLKAKGTLGSPYAVRDYDAIDPAYGTPDDLKQLIAAAHKRGLKVFIDIVANHTSWDSVLMKHPDWYKHDAAGHIIPPNPDWVDVAQLDYSNPELRQYMTGMLTRWLRDYGLDGFRCDYASGVPTDFWESVRPELDRARPGVVMLAEADDPALLKTAFDFDYAWDFYNAMGDAMAGRAPASLVRATWEKAEARYPKNALHLRFSDNHDQLRATAQFGLPAALAASAVMFTLDGAPLLYNGMEIGDTTESAAPSLFERVPIRWEFEERRPQVAPFYKALAAFRRAHPALTRGTVRWLRNDDPQRVLSYERASASESLVVVVNLSSQNYSGVVETGAGEYQDVTPGGSSSAPRASTLPAVFLAPWEWRVFSRGTR
jgi:cyclomaltodextrinase / maltogenic alpha-amylase / neopullulanase